MNYDKLGRLVEEYLKTNPVDESRTYYDWDSGAQSGRNDVKEDLIKFMEECK